MKALYEYLSRFGFTRPGTVQARLQTIRAADIDSLFDGYEQAVWPEPRIVRYPHGQISVLSDSWGALPSTKVILQLALYVDRAVFHDPILDLRAEWDGLAVHPQYVMRYSDSDERKRAFAIERLGPVMAKLLVLKDLALAGLVVLAPTALLGGTREPGALYASDFYGPTGGAYQQSGRPHPLERYPASLRRAALESISVCPVKADLKGNMEPQWGTPLSPTRTIGLGFRDEASYKITVLASAWTEAQPDRIVRGKYHPDDPVDEASFSHWVDGTKAELACERLGVLGRDLVVAGASRASLLTTSQTASKLLRVSEAGVPKDVLPRLLTLELPYFESVVPKDLVQARQNEAAFQDFRLALEQALEKVALSSSPGAEERALREAVVAPLAQVEARMRSLAGTKAIDAAILAGTLAAGFFSHNESVLGVSILAATQVLGHYRNQKEAEDQIKQSRGYFYWDVTRGQRTP